MLRHTIWMIFFLPILLLINTSTVFACSGGGYPSMQAFLEARVAGSDYIVVGQFAELDDTNTNGIFEVETYLLGDVNQPFLTISVNDIRNIENALNVHRVYPCGGNSIFYRKINQQNHYIFFLTRTDDGIYHANRYFPFISDTSTARYTFDDAPQPLTINDLETLITEITDTAYIPDQETEFYPRTTPILMRTSSGQHYVLPVDSDIPLAISAEDALMRSRNQVTCNTPPCVVWSPNGLNEIHLLNPDDDYVENDWMSITQTHNVIGARIMVSTSSETFALWQNTGLLEIYVTWSPDYGFPDGRFEGMYTPVKVNEIQLSASSLNYPAIWSHDGRSLVFSDDDGLWIWDVYSEGFDPQLLIATNHTIPVARYFSPQGRYLAVTDGDRRYNLDLVTRRELPDGYLSPEDRILLVFDTAHDNGSNLEVMYLAPNNGQFEYYPRMDYQQVQWIDETHFLTVVSGMDYLEYETGEQIDEGTWEAIPILIEEPYTTIRSFHISGDSYSYPPYHLPQPHYNRFIYHPELGTLRISVDGYYLNIIPFTNLADYLDAPIETAEWLPSAFYYEED